LRYACAQQRMASNARPPRAPHARPASAVLACLRQGLRFPVVTWVAVLLGLAMTMPSAGAGLLLDDHLHAAFIRQHLAQGSGRWWDLFDICCRQGTPTVAERIGLGMLPWWTHPQLKIALFRPLSVATQYLDYVLWPNTPLLMHLHNMAWYALIIALVGALYRRLMTGGAAALGTLLYAIDESHAEGAAWIASRNTLMSAAFALAAVLAYARWRGDGWRPGLWAAPLAILLGLASGEGAIAAWAFLLPYALWIDRGPTIRRALSLAPLAAVTLGWQLVYRKLGYGVHGSGWYRDPFDGLWFFVRHRVPDVLPSVLREQFLAPTAAARSLPFLASPLSLWVLWAVCALSLPVWFRMLVRRREIAFWTCALFAAALPICAIGMSPRLLFLSSVASLALIAELLVELWTIARVAVTPASTHASSTFVNPAGKALRATALGLTAVWLSVHGPLALALAPRAYRSMVEYDHLFEMSAERLPAFDRTHVDTMFVLNTPNYFVTSLSPAYARAHPWPAHVFILGATVTSFRISRPDVYTIRLTPKDGYLVEPLSQLVRAPEVPFERGQLIGVGPLLARVDELTPDGRPASVSFRSYWLDASNVLWVACYDGRYHSIELPAVGASFEVPGA
jgi:hypothetical protein